MTTIILYHNSNIDTYSMYEYHTNLLLLLRLIDANITQPVQYSFVGDLCSSTYNYIIN
jgi:hypothetical protein